MPALLLAAYIVGAVPFGLIIARWWAGIDVREHGSGNIGATNVYRVVGRPAGVLVFVLDVLKGLWPPLAASALGMGSWVPVAGGLAAFFGHSASPFLGFKGGKGVATSLGVLFGVAWKVGVTAWALWGVALAVTGYVSLGSVLAAASLAPLSLVFYHNYPGDYWRLGFCLVAGLITIYRHRANIGRLLHGTENRFGHRQNQATGTAPAAEEQQPSSQAK